MRLLRVALLGFVVGCAGREPEPVELVPFSRLDEGQREALVAYAEGGERWRVQRERLAEDPALARFVAQNLMVEMVSAYQASRIARAGQAQGPFERAERELVALGEPGLQVAVLNLRVRQGVVGTLAGEVLEGFGGRAAVPVAELLGDADPEVRRRAAELLGRLPDAPREAEVVERLARCVGSDPAWIVRATAAESLGRRGSRGGDREAIQKVLLEALGDRDPAVVESAARGLGLLGERSSIPALINLLERAQRGERLSTVSSIQAALLALAPGAERRDAAGWRAWWRANR